jgi:hypothetical protein
MKKLGQIWAYLNTPTEKIEHKDSKKLIVELLLKDKTIEETIILFNSIEAEVKEHASKTFDKKMKSIEAINNFCNPEIKPFKERAQEIKEKYNYKFDKK